MRIDFLGHAAFLLTDSRGVRVLTDPYNSGGFSGRVGYSPIEDEVDVVVITHDHLDHCHTEGLRGSFEVIRHAGVACGVEVKSVQAYHDMHQGTRFGGTVDMKLITLDGLRICHTGDLGELLEQHHLDTLGEVDILIIAVGGYYTLDADGAYTVTKKINPKLVIPCHYKTPKCGFDIATEAPFLAHFSSEKRIEPGGSFYHVTPPLTFDSTTCLHLHPRL